MQMRQEYEKNKEKIVQPLYQIKIIQRKDEKMRSRSALRALDKGSMSLFYC